MRDTKGSRACGKIAPGLTPERMHITLGATRKRPAGVGAALASAALAAAGHEKRAVYVSVAPRLPCCARPFGRAQGLPSVVRGAWSTAGHFWPWCPPRSCTSAPSISQNSAISVAPIRCKCRAQHAASSVPHSCFAAMVRRYPRSCLPERGPTTRRRPSFTTGPSVHISFGADP